MSTDLGRIGEKARKDREVIFTSLYHHVTDVDNLRSCYDALPGDRAVGVDGVTKEEYGRQLGNNLNGLSERLKRMGYKPQPKRRGYIPKPGSDQGRPLGISCFEDKIVELAVKRVLEPIYETVFLDSSHGYRPGRSQHRCLEVLGRTIQQAQVNRVVEADIAGFFNEVDHGWMIKFIELRIGDPRIIRLIRRMLKGGILEDGRIHVAEEGTSQGSILSPLLSNIYLHYTLDEWFSKIVQPRCRGEAYFFRYADDFVACFQYKTEAETYLKCLEIRVERFGLELALDKTGSMEFGRFARSNARNRGDKPAEFTFLGFVHYCGKTKRGYFKVKRRTDRKKMGQGLRRFSDWARKSRGWLSKGDMLRSAKTRVQGHLNYYAITDNAHQCDKFVYHATCQLFKWLNRKSQRRAYTWDGFNHVLRYIGWPQVQIRVDLNPCRRAEAY